MKGNPMNGVIEKAHTIITTAGEGNKRRHDTY